MKRLQLMILGLILVFVAQASAQELNTQGHWSAEFRSGAAFATQDLGETELGTGFGFEGTVGYRFMPHMGAYAGWGWHHFPGDDTFASADVDFEETGYVFGFKFNHPLGHTGFNYVVQLGGILNHIEVENDDGDVIADSDHGLGWEVGGGLAFPIGEQIQLMPMVRYRSLSQDLDTAAGDQSVDLTYLSFNMGLNWTF